MGLFMTLFFCEDVLGQDLVYGVLSDNVLVLGALTKRLVTVGLDNGYCLFSCF